MVGGMTHVWLLSRASWNAIYGRKWRYYARQQLSSWPRQARQNGASTSVLFGGGTARYYTHEFSSAYALLTALLLIERQILPCPVRRVWRPEYNLCFQHNYLMNHLETQLWVGLTGGVFFHFISSCHQPVSSPRVLHPLLVPPASYTLSPLCQLLRSTMQHDLPKRSCLICSPQMSRPGHCGPQHRDGELSLPQTV